MLDVMSYNHIHISRGIVYQDLWSSLESDEWFLVPFGCTNNLFYRQGKDEGKGGHLCWVKSILGLMRSYFIFLYCCHSLFLAVGVLLFFFLCLYSFCFSAAARSASPWLKPWGHWEPQHSPLGSLHLFGSVVNGSREGGHSGIHPPNDGHL